MSILLSLGKSRTHAETDALCRVLDDRADALRESKLGKRFRTDRYEFRRVQADRNVVYQVSLQNHCRWYLKLPRHRESDVLQRERLGLQSASQSLDGNAGYRHPDAWRVSLDHEYVLTAEVLGRSLQTNFYRSLLVPWPTSRSAVATQFFYLGDCLARLHAVEVSDDLTQTRGLRDVLVRECRQAKRRDAICEQVEQVAEGLTESRDSSHFTHGNLGLNNVLAAENQITMIDFECSGRGSIYDDLSLVCGCLLYASAASHISTRRVTAAIDSFLGGYREFGQFDASILSRHNALRIGQKYVYCVCNHRSPTVAGIPLSVTRLRLLLTKLLHESSVDLIR